MLPYGFTASVFDPLVTRAPDTKDIIHLQSSILGQPWPLQRLDFSQAESWIVSTILSKIPHPPHFFPSYKTGSVKVNEVHEYA